MDDTTCTRVQQEIWGACPVLKVDKRFTFWTGLAIMHSTIWSAVATSQSLPRTTTRRYQEGFHSTSACWKQPTCLCHGCIAV
jgi:hypothetical protein